MTQVFDPRELRKKRSTGKIAIDSFKTGTGLKAKDLLLLRSPCDLGVQRNLGRLGARFAPQAIEACLGSLVKGQNLGQIYGKDFPVEALPTSDYSLVHLGGGHDHVYSLLMTLSQLSFKITIINLDPHCDTRTDSEPHSGNPFRRFIKDCPKWSGELIQLGINETTNDTATLEGVKNMKVIFYDEFWKQTKGFTAPVKLESYLEKETDILVISLDCDVIESSLMEAVSSVSFKGIPGNYLRSQILAWKNEFQGRSVLGVYEYNPLYDNLSQKGARYISSLVYDWWKVS